MEISLAPGQATGKDAASVVTEDPSLKRLWREGLVPCGRVQVPEESFYVRLWQCSPAAETPGIRRCRNCGMTSENSGSCGAQVAGAGETGWVRCEGGARETRLSTSSGEQKIILNVRHQTLSNLHFWSLVLPCSCCNCALVLPSWNKKIIIITCFLILQELVSWIS